MCVYIYLFLKIETETAKIDFARSSFKPDLIGLLSTYQIA